MVVTYGHSELHLEFPCFLYNGANFVFQDNKNHHFTQPLCLSACGFSKSPALSLLLVLTHTMLLPRLPSPCHKPVFPKGAHSSPSSFNPLRTCQVPTGAVSNSPSTFSRYFLIRFISKLTGITLSH